MSDPSTPPPSSPAPPAPAAAKSNKKIWIFGGVGCLVLLIGLFALGIWAAYYGFTKAKAAVEEEMAAHTEASRASAEAGGESSQQLPDWFPTLPPDAEVSVNFTMNNERGTSGSATVSLPGTPAKAAENLRAAILDAGFTSNANLSLGSLQTASFSRDNGALNIQMLGTKDRERTGHAAFQLIFSSEER